MMVRFTGGESDDGDGLAPVTPLFGGANTTSGPRFGGESPQVATRAPLRDAVGGAPGWNSVWTEPYDGSDDDEYDSCDEYDGYADDGYDACGAIEREIAEKNLLKKLRGRSLSVREARAVVAERDLDDAAVAAVLAAFERLGYLDDARLADQLVHAGVGRKGQGRQVIAQTMIKRGIPREIADAALEALPDDDAERALDFARSKARSLRDADRDTALRRLTGQLARRGYGGSVAMTAARAALDEQSPPSTGVRFR